MGGNTSFIEFMDRHFEGGHNLHTNEPSHHIVCLPISYRSSVILMSSLISTITLEHPIRRRNGYGRLERGSIIIPLVDFLVYVSSPTLSSSRNQMQNSGQITDVQNEDCGQMSAWYLFSAMGFYPGEFSQLLDIQSS